jgi:phosphohistidine phosphatase
MLLHLLRHAHAGDAFTFDGPDAERPLTEKGRSQSRRLGRFLADRKFVTDLVLTSPKVRARETAEIVAGHLAMPVVVDDRLGAAIDLAMLEGILRDQHDPVRPILVGHDPDFSELLAALSCAGGVPMRKGAFARIEVDRPLRAGTGTLRWLLPPDALRTDD